MPFFRFLSLNFLTIYLIQNISSDESFLLGLSSITVVFGWIFKIHLVVWHFLGGNICQKSTTDIEPQKERLAN